MSEIVRSAIVRLRGALGIHRARRSVRLPLTVSLSGRNLPAYSRQDCCAGHTRDLSARGLSFVLPSVHLGNRHIFGNGDAALRIRLELPGGAVDLTASPVRYDLLEGREAERAYLVGALIVDINAADRARYLEFLRARRRATTAGAQIKTTDPASA